MNKKLKNATIKNSSIILKHWSTVFRHQTKSFDILVHLYPKLIVFGRTSLLSIFYFSIIFFPTPVKILWIFLSWKIYKVTWHRFIFLYNLLLDSLILNLFKILFPIQGIVLFPHKKGGFPCPNNTNFWLSGKNLSTYTKHSAHLPVKSTRWTRVPMTWFFSCPTTQP